VFIRRPFGPGCRRHIAVPPFAEPGARLPSAARRTSKSIPSGRSNHRSEEHPVLLAVSRGSFEARYESGGFLPAMRRVLEHRDIHPVESTATCVSAALLSFNVLSVLQKQSGGGGLPRLFLSQATVAAGPTRVSTQERRELRRLLLAHAVGLPAPRMEH